MIKTLRNQSELQASREGDPNFAGTLAKGLMILQMFVREPRPHANSEIAEMLGLPRPTVSRLCKTLLEMGFLDHDDRIDRYFIGPAAMALSYPYIVSTPALLEARSAMQALANQAQGAVCVGVPLDLDIVYIYTCAYREGTLARPETGAVRALVETSMGRAWMFTLDTRERANILRRVRKERPEQAERSMAGVKESLSMQAKLGFAINRGDAGFGVLGVGVASQLRHGARPLLFNCVVPGLGREMEDLFTNVGPRLCEIVRLAERNAGRR
jgi:DNA-binding IclR family transcriptional regulator